MRMFQPTNTMNRLQILLLSFALCFAFIQVAHSQSMFQHPQNMGMGGGGTAYMHDYRANFINPANIGFTEEDSYVIFNAPVMIPSFNVQAGGSLLKVSKYNEYFTKGLTITNQMLQDEVLPAFFDDQNMQTVQAGADVMLFGVSLHMDELFGLEQVGMSLAGRTRVVNQNGVSEGLVRLMLGGVNETLFDSPRAVDLYSSSMSFSEISLGFSSKVYEFDFMGGDNSLYAGAAPKLIFSNSYFEADLASTMQVAQGDFIRHNVDYTIKATDGLAGGFDRLVNDREAYPDSSLFDLIDGQNYFDEPASGVDQFNGVSMGIDLGVTHVYQPRNDDLTLTTSLSITDIGSVSYNDNAGVYKSKGEFLFEGVTYDEARIENDFDDEPGDYLEFILKDSLATNAYGNLAKEDNSFSKALPTSLNFGVRGDYRITSWATTMVSFDYIQGMNDVGLNSTNPVFVLGNEWVLWGSWPLRVGTRVGGDSSSLFSFGTGVEFDHIEFSFSAIGSPGSDDGMGVGVALGGFIVKL